jgi:dienelactone hydrolase
MSVRILRGLIVATVLTVLAPAVAGAQNITIEERVRNALRTPDLKFPAEPKSFSMFRSGMAIYKPEGAGPYPALVLLHSCSGIRTEITDWAKDAVARGYVAFVLDSLGPRGQRSVCIPAAGNVSPFRGVKDTFQALAHLEKLPFVDRERIGLIGFSWGAMVGLIGSGASFADMLSDGKRFGAVVSFYPACWVPAVRNLPEFEFLRPDTDRPVMVLMGDADNETPPSECVPRLKALADKGVPVEWHLYPNATHCWDCSSLHNVSKKDYRGNTVVYQYDKAITKDSADRAFAFLERRLSRTAR